MMCETSLHRKFDKFSAELHPIPVRDEVWHTVGVDMIGPLPETPRGNKYIMTVSCLFSKWPEATALPDKSAEGVATLLLQCFSRHGCCSVKITDQGREFVNKVHDYSHTMYSVHWVYTHIIQYVPVHVHCMYTH